MARRPIVTLPLMAGLGLLFPLNVVPAQTRPAQEGKPPKPPKPAPAPKPQVQQPAGRGQQGRVNGQGNPAGEKLFERLLKMNPEERDKALANLPPARRRQIEQRIRNLQSKPPAAQARTLNQLERLAALPPERRTQVRQSIRQFNQLPRDQKGTIRQEMQRLSAMTAQERRARMSSEDFKSHYSPDEQKMIGDLAEVLPQR